MSDLHKALIAGFIFGVMFSLTMIKIIVLNPTDAAFKHCEELLEVSDE